MAYPSLPASPSDELFRALELGSRHNEALPNIGAVLHIDGEPPRIDALRAALAGPVSKLPTLNHRLVCSTSRAEWVPAPAVPGVHVTELRIGPGDGEVERAAEALLLESLPGGVAPWRLVLLHGHRPGGYALVYIVRHELQDAGGLVCALEWLFARHGGTQDWSSVVRGLDGARRAGPREALEVLGDTKRAARPIDWWSAPYAELTGRRSLHWAEVPAEALSRAGHSVGGTANDAYLTALTRAVSDWAQETWPATPAGDLPVVVPINLRTQAEFGMPGNFIHIGRFPLPRAAADPAEQLAATAAVTAAVKSLSYRRFLRELDTRPPKPVLRWIGARTTAADRLSVVGSHFTLRRPLWCGEHPVRRVVPLMCCPEGFPMCALLFRYAGTATVSFRIDRALTGAATIPERWSKAVADLAAPDDAPSGT